MNIYREKQALGFWVFILLAVPLMGRTEAWRQDRMQKIEDSRSLPPEERIPILGSIVAAGYPDRMMPPNNFQLEVAAMARAEMLVIPGHAECYRDRILSARLKYEETPDDDRWVRLHKLDAEQISGFQILALLPSAETLRVLGEFLADDRGKIGGPGPPPLMDGKRSAESANSTLALHALHTLPLANKPVAAKHVYADKDLETYRLWYAQLKSGNRTFRFEGDPTEYDLDGPAPPEKLRRIAEHRTRDQVRTNRNHPEGAVANATTPAAGAAPASGSSPSLPVLVAAGLAILAALWYFLRAWKGRSA